jgi:hypothetical protein
MSTIDKIIIDAIPDPRNIFWADDNSDLASAAKLLKRDNEALTLALLACKEHAVFEGADEWTREGQLKCISEEVDKVLGLQVMNDE